MKISKISDGKFYKQGRELYPCLCKSGNHLEVIYAPNDLEASKQFKANNTPNMVVDYVIDISEITFDRLILTKL